MLDGSIFGIWAPLSHVIGICERFWIICFCFSRPWNLIRCRFDQIPFADLRSFSSQASILFAKIEQSSEAEGYDICI